jgi:hypothetical protein
LLVLALFPRVALRALIALALVLFSAPGWAQSVESPGPAPNLLAELTPVRSNGVFRAGELTDGRIGVDESQWKTEHTAVFFDTASWAVFDLGREVTIGAALLQGDSNDAYDLALSSDGKAFSVLWTAPAVSGTGLRMRKAAELAGSGRYLRIRPVSGDGRFGVSEVQVFAAVPSPFPPLLPEVRGMSLDLRFRNATLTFGLSMVVSLLLLRRGAGRARVAFGVLLPLIAGGQFMWSYIDAWPLESREVALVRGTVAAVAAVALLRELISSGRFAAERRAVSAVLGVCAVLAFAAFYNLGQPQFYSIVNGRWTYAHHLDLRQYYPTAKYFSELGYRRLYEADVAAYFEDNSTVDRESLRDVHMRDLQTLDMSTIGARAPEIAAIRERFKEPRWEEYKRDARWFRTTMGNQDYLASLQDFGGNATPVWIGIAHVLFSAFAPNDTVFTLTGAFDLALLVGMFIAIFRTFGARPALVSMIVFGANDFIMYGTNWSGATLRHDWLAYIGLGVCALRREKWLLGGALLGLSAMIRAFPALCVAGACLPALMRVVEQVWTTRRLPALRDLLARERSTLYIVLGAGLAVAAAFAFSIAVGPLQAWGDWYNKVSQMESDSHPATVALRNLIGGWEHQRSMLKARAPVYFAAIVFYVGMVLWASRRRRPEQTALLGVALLPVLLYPANYYIHFVFLLPLVVAETPGKTEEQPVIESTRTAVWVTLLAMCAAQYFTVPVTDLGLHFYMATALLFSALTVMLVLLVRQDVLLEQKPALAGEK